MAQVGLTLGARHIPATARHVGYGVSYSRRLGDAAKIEHDSDVVAASGIVWSMVTAALPGEVIQPIISILDRENIPHLATRWVEPGEVSLHILGYSI